MSMPLDFINLEFFTWGFMGGIYTGTWAGAYALTALWWFTLVWLGVHREDAEPYRSDFHTWYLIPLTAGVFTGLASAWSQNLGQLVDTQFFNLRNNKRYLAPEFFLLVIFVTVIVAGAYYAMGHFSDGIATLPLTTARAIGIPMLVLGGIATVLLFIWQLTSKRDRFNKVMNFKYTLSLAVGMTVQPALYDFLMGSIHPWHGAVALAGIIVYWLLTYAWLAFFYAGADGRPILSGKFFGNDRTPLDQTDRFYSKLQAQQFVLYNGISQFIVILVVWLVDVTTGDNVKPPAAAAAISAIVFILISVALRFNGIWVKTPLSRAYSGLAGEEGEPLQSTASNFSTTAPATSRRKSVTPNAQATITLTTQF